MPPARGSGAPRPGGRGSPHIQKSGFRRPFFTLWPGIRCQRGRSNRLLREARCTWRGPLLYLARTCDGPRARICWSWPRPAAARRGSGAGFDLHVKRRGRGPRPSACAPRWPALVRWGPSAGRRLPVPCARPGAASRGRAGGGWRLDRDREGVASCRDGLAGGFLVGAAHPAAAGIARNACRGWPAAGSRRGSGNGLPGRAHRGADSRTAAIPLRWLIRIPMGYLLRPEPHPAADAQAVAEINLPVDSETVYRA